MGHLAATIREWFSRLCDSKAGLAGLAILAAWLLVALVGYFWTPYDPLAFDVASRFQAPGPDHWLGTDKFGRDVLSRIMSGAAYVLLLALSGALIALTLGTAIGLSAGYRGGLTDEILMRAMDVLMSFPSLLLAILVLGTLGAGFLNVVLVVGIVFCPRVARVVRGTVMEVKPCEFVDAARLRGETDIAIMLREILPNILGPLGVEFSVRFAYAIFLSASLGFLGLGVQPPTPDWGLMINENRGFIVVAPWTVVFPGLAISSLVIGVNLLADAFRQLASGEV
ncbi:MAG: ABC transporter permease [Deltaproteobacteria bacterium]|nr:ABC transporter permease [Deltaproteobacteria bacterium]